VAASALAFDLALALAHDGRDPFVVGDAVETHPVLVEEADEQLQDQVPPGSGLFRLVFTAERLVRSVTIVAIPEAA
jgi:hypothetical protein